MGHDCSQLLEVHFKEWDAAVLFAADLKVDATENRLDGTATLSAGGPAQWPKVLTHCP